MTHNSQTTPVERDPQDTWAYSHEQLHEGFANKISAITSRPLVPESIDTYADQALNDLIDVVKEVEYAYHAQPTLIHDTARENEVAAFNYFGLTDVESTLDHIADKAKELQEIDQIITHAPQVRGVIVPTDDIQPNIMTGNGEFKEKQLIPRTKTTLFILANAFDVDLNDPEQFRMRSGEILPNMMRKTSYNIIETPGLDRTVLVCDEEGNATYVIDNSILEKAGITSDNLSSLTKTEINEYLKNYPTLGERITYSDKFVDNIIQGLTKISEKLTPAELEEKPSVNFLDPAPKAPKAPEDYLSINGISTLFGVSKSAIENSLSSIDPEELGMVSQFKFGPNTARGFSPQQQEIIKAHLETDGYLSGEFPDGYISIRSMANELGVSVKTIIDLAKSIETEEFGELVKIRVKGQGQKAYALSPAQQQVLLSRMEEKGLFAPHAPEDYLTIKGIAKALGLDRSAVERAVKLIGEDVLGSAEQMKLGNLPASVFSPTQQEIISQKIREEGYIDLQPAPEGYLSINLLRKKLGISQGPIQAVLKTIDSEELGPISQFKFGSTRAEGLSPSQQALIIQKLEERGTFAEAPPEGYLSMTVLSKKLEVAVETLEKAIERIDPEQLGPISKFKFITKTVTGLSPNQQKMVINKLYEEELLTPKAPEGYLSRLGLAKRFNVNSEKVGRIIDQLAAEGILGEIKSFRFKKAPRPYKGYSPDQQELILARLNQHEK